jgi:Amt family ammonium transporter
MHKIQGSNLPFAVLGALLLWVGWIGFNGGSTLALNEQVPGIIVNTVLSGVGGMIAAMILSQLQYHRVEVEDLINGTLAGLVSITACCHVVSNPVAIIVGITSMGVAKLVSQTLKRCQIDDAVDAVAVHGGAGIWGTLCVALFGQGDLLNLELNFSRGRLLLVQVLGVSTALVWAFSFTWLVLQLISHFIPLRVSAEAEELGLNVAEHAAKTDTYELFQIMDLQARTHDLTLRVPVESFTEIGHIATRYNQVIDALEENHHQNVESLEELYAITATAVSAIENNHFSPSELEAFCDRPDELGILARTLQQMLATLNSQQQELLQAKQQLEFSHANKQQLIKEIVLKILQVRFETISPATIDLIDSILEFSEDQKLVQQAIKVSNIDEFHQLLLTHWQQTI